jgi:hypothetical protein
MSKKCNICGVKLNYENRYMRSGNRGHEKICKECYKERRNQRYKNTNNRPTCLVIRKYHSGIIEFPSLEAKKQFLVDRKCQTVVSVVRNGHTSRVGQSVDHLIEEEDPNTGQILRSYTKTLCHECGGIVRFDSNGFKCCSVCGLLDTNYTLSNEFEIRGDGYNMPQRRYYSHARHGPAP